MSHQSSAQQQIANTETEANKSSQNAFTEFPPSILRFAIFRNLVLSQMSTPTQFRLKRTSTAMYDQMANHISISKVSEAFCDRATKLITDGEDIAKMMTELEEKLSGIPTDDPKYIQLNGFFNALDKELQKVIDLYEREERSMAKFLEEYGLSLPFG